MSVYIPLYSLGWNSVIRLNTLRVIIKGALYCLNAETYRELHMYYNLR